MATLALGIIGAIAVPANPALGFEIGAAVGALLFPSQQTSSATLADAKASGGSYGTPIPILYGENEYPAQILYSTNFFQDGTQGGNKKFSGTQQWGISILLLVCRSNQYITNSTIQYQIWMDDVLLYDSQNTQTGFESVTAVRFHDGNATQTVDPLISANSPFGVAYRGNVTIAIEGINVSPFGNRTPNFKVKLLPPQLNLAQILEDFITDQSPLTGADIDVTACTGINVTGFNCPGKVPRQDSITGLLKMYFVDQVEVDGLIRFVPQGGSVAGTFQTADLGASSGKSAESTPISEVDAQQADMISLLSVRYTASDQLFDTGSATERNCLVTKQNESQVTVPVTLDKVAAQNFARAALYGSYASRWKYAMALPPKYLKYVPSDPVNIPYLGTIQRVRLTEVDWQPNDPVLKFQAVSEDISTLLQYAEVAAVSSANIPRYYGFAPALPFYAWSGTEISDADVNAAGFYCGMAGLTTGLGATIYYTTDATFTAGVVNAGRISQNSIFGFTTSTLATYPAGWDPYSTVYISLQNYVASLVPADMSAVPPSNIVKIGNEYLGFTTPTVFYPSQYILSELLRGYRGTPTSGHTTGDKFVFMDSTIQRITVPNSLIGVIVYIKIVSDNEAISAVTAQAVTIAVPSGSPGQPTSVVAADPTYSGTTEYILFTAILPGLVVPAPGTTFNWEYSTDGGSTWSSAASSGPSYNSPGFTSGTMMVRAQQVNSLGASAWTTSLNISYTTSASAVHFYRDAFTGDNTTTNWTLTHSPASSSESVFVNDALQDPTTDYTLSGTTLTISPALPTGAKLRVLYSY